MSVTPPILCRLPAPLLLLLCALGGIALAAAPPPASAQEDQPEGLDGGFSSAFQSCFGISDITDPRALAICDALFLRENVRARELAQQWVNEQPGSPAAHFALSEVLSRVEGNLPRALHHLHRAEDLMDYSSMGRALADGMLEWHYLTLHQLANQHQLIGNQELALQYLEEIEAFYGQDTESLRGWPLIKLQRYAEARASAERVLASSNEPQERSRAWNTLCAVELADLKPLESMEACENSMSEEAGVSLLEDSTAADTVHLLNAAEVSLSLLRFGEAEQYLDRASRYINPDSVGNPWVSLLYLYMNQGRFDEARQALDRMLSWRNSQRPLVTVMNRADHLMVSAMFLLLTGYPEDAARLTRSALDQPDRTGSYSADERQKDAIATLLNHMAHRLAWQMKREQIATMGLFESLPHRLQAAMARFRAWRSGRQTASLFADRGLLMNRLRPYAPLDVHIPEWVEPELLDLMGHGMMATLLDETERAGAFALNDGYYHAARTGIAWQRGDLATTIESGMAARRTLPAEEVLLKARLAVHIAEAAWRRGDTATALDHYEAALRSDPSTIRRLGARLPVQILSADDPELVRLLGRSPRFRVAEGVPGLRIDISDSASPALCLRSRDGDALGCVGAGPQASADDPMASLVLAFQNHLFGAGVTLSREQRLALLGGSIISLGRDRSVTGQMRAILED